MCPYTLYFKLRGKLTLTCIKWVPGDPRIIFLVTSFIRKMAESSDSMHSSIFMLENISFYPKWTKLTINFEFYSKYGSLGTQTKLEQNSQFLVDSVHLR